MLKIQEAAITSSGQVQVTLPQGAKVLQAVTIGGSSMVRAFVDTTKPNTTMSLNVVVVGNDVGGDLREQQWLGYIILGGATYDVFLENV